MKNYGLDTEFTFGKYSGKTLKDILEENPYYINWCIKNVQDFNISAEVFNVIFKMYPRYPLTPAVKEAIENKWSYAREKNEEKMNREDDMDYGSTYDQYSGSYAQDVEGYSDDEINDAFDGDPDAYWNID